MDLNPEAVKQEIEAVKVACDEVGDLSTVLPCSPQGLVAGSPACQWLRDLALRHGRPQIENEGLSNVVNCRLMLVYGVVRTPGRAAAYCPASPRSLGNHQTSQATHQALMHITRIAEITLGGF